MNSEHYVDLKGKKHVLWQGLLAMAHEKGIASIDEEIVQIPTEENGNLAITKAVVTDSEGRTWAGLGDASPQSVSRNIQAHLLRMSSTRAKARALRDMLNIDMTAFEETGGEEPEKPKRELAVLDGEEITKPQLGKILHELDRRSGLQRARFTPIADSQTSSWEDSEITSPS